MTLVIRRPFRRSLSCPVQTMLSVTECCIDDQLRGSSEQSSTTRLPFTSPDCYQLLLHRAAGTCKTEVPGPDIRTSRDLYVKRALQ
jgi:hypothetical protein